MQRQLLIPKQGDYQEEMKTACYTAANRRPGEQAESIFFSCEDGLLKNHIIRIEECVTCEDGGSGKSDYCFTRQ